MLHGSKTRPRLVDVPLGERTLRLHRFTPETPLHEVPVLCVHGLSANGRGFDPLARALVGAGHTVVSIDLRGRGHSACTGPGTYGWRAHARDLIDVVDWLGVDRVDVVGHSMGAYIGMQLAVTAPSRLRRLVLVDGVGMPEPAAMPKILGSLQRLSSSYRSFSDYLARVRSVGTIEPWSDDWARYFEYEIETGASGEVRPRTSAAAVMEDALYGSTQDPRVFWPSLRMPTLVVRATRPLGEPGGFIVRASDCDDLKRLAPDVCVVEVDANHYGVLMHCNTSAAIGGFLA